MIHDKDTIIALSTAPGAAAIAVIRLSGPQAIDLVNQHLVGKNLMEEDGYTLHYASLVSREGEMIDEVVVSLFRSPRSYTGEDMVEISVHGSPFIVNKTLTELQESGARLAGPGEFTQRAFLNGKLNLSQAEAVADLIASESQSTHDIAMKQMRGGFTTLLQELRQRLIDFAALIELELDFSEEDVEFADRRQLKDLIQTIQTEITKLIDSFAYGNAIKEGIPVVIAGKPNAGKSSLLNALLHEDKAIVSDIAGTTRDSIEDTIVIDGIKFRLTDTAGLRETEDTIEAIGVKRAEEKIRQAQVLIYLFDLATTTPQEVIDAVESYYRPDLHVLLAQTHIDLYKHGEYEKEYMEISEALIGKYHAQMGIALKHKKHRGTLDILKLQLTQIAAGMKPQSSVIVSNARHVEALRKAQKSLDEVRQGLDSQVSGDFLAQDIRHALYHIGSITGEVDVDQDILGSIFGKFCIGK